MHELAAQNLQRGTSTAAPIAALAAALASGRAAAGMATGADAKGVVASSSHKLLRFSRRLVRSSEALGAAGTSRTAMIVSVAVEDGIVSVGWVYAFDAPTSSRDRLQSDSSVGQDAFVTFASIKVD
jgi:hypothetical protein